MSFHDAFYAIAAFAAVMLAVPFACRLAVKSRFVDRPGGRKQHRGAVPPVGGLVIMPVFLILSLFLPGTYMPGFYMFALAVLLMLIVGALDDRFHLPARVKFAAQFAASIIMVVPGGAAITSLGDLFGFGAFGLGWMSIPFSVVATVLLMNAVNLLDGLDGLAGGISFVALCWFAVACVITGGGGYGLPLLLVLMGALAAFLVYNMRHPWREKAALFLGDSGSLTLGLALAWFAMKLADIEIRVIEPMAVAWVLALPIMDTCGQFARRVREGRHPFDADQNHFHHHFIASGMSVRKATFLILLVTFVTGLIGVGGVALGVPLPVLTLSWIALLFLHIWLSVKPERMKALAARLHRP